MVANQIYAATCAVPAMRERRWGRLLTVASSAAVQPIGGMALSNSLRTSLLAWNKTLAAEVAGDGVTCNVILPGRIDTRSEEHTSELQSLMRISYAVFCLKKKKTQNTSDTANLDKLQT